MNTPTEAQVCDSDVSWLRKLKSQVSSALSQISASLAWHHHQDTTVIQLKETLKLQPSTSPRSVSCSCLCRHAVLDYSSTLIGLQSRHWIKYLDDFLLGINEQRETPTVSRAFWQCFRMTGENKSCFKSQQSLSGCHALGCCLGGRQLGWRGQFLS